MPNANYLEFTLTKLKVDLSDSEEVPIDIDYQLESEDNFQQKKSSQSLDIDLPATKNNDRIFNSFHDPNIENVLENSSPKNCLIKANGVELFKGLALLNSVTSIEKKPVAYNIDCYGNNGDWIIPFQDKTLHDFVSPHTHILGEGTVAGSWSFNGTSEVDDYVYAPVRYRNGFSEDDTRVNVLDLRPSISIYWIIYRAFQSLGYKIQSNFLDSNYFRRSVMPWTWGNFLFIDSSKVDPLRFKVTGLRTPLAEPDHYWHIQTAGGSSGTAIVGTSGSNITVNSWDMSNDSPPDGYDNGGNYSYLGNGIMKYLYNASVGALFGTIDIEFTISVAVRKVGDSPFNLGLDWTKNTGGTGNEFIASEDTIPNGITTIVSKTFIVPAVPVGAEISMAFVLDYNTSAAGSVNVMVFAMKFGNALIGQGLHQTTLEATGFIKTSNSVIDIKIYDGFKNYRFLDFLRGVFDCFDLSVQTDNVNKVVLIEPTHPYYLDNDPSSKSTGYFIGSGQKTWDKKVDLSKQSTLELYRDSEQELLFKFKDDSNDGGVKVFNERYSALAASSKYLFPPRFKQGKREVENRFFAPVVHVDMDSWKSYSNEKIAPQIIAIIPENIANTSGVKVDEQAFLPRIAWYKPYTGTGSSNDNGRFNFEGAVTGAGIGSFKVPQMFAVNYKPSGINDPVLTYNDQNIDGVVVHGLMRRFFLPRLAIMRNGKRLTSYFKLTMGDITNWFHREKVSLNGSEYLLFNIYKFRPLKNETTKCLLWKNAPISQTDSDNCFPSLSSVEGTGVTSGNDITYNKLLLLTTDITGE